MLKTVKGSGQVVRAGKCESRMKQEGAKGGKKEIKEEHFQMQKNEEGLEINTLKELLGKNLHT